MKPNQPKTKQCNLVVKTKWVKKNIRTDTIIFNLVMLWLFNNTPSTITNIGNSVKLGNTQKSTDQILETAQTRSDLINERVPNKMREIKWRKCRTSFPENGISWVEPLKNEKKTEGGGELIYCKIVERSKREKKIPDIFMERFAVDQPFHSEVVIVRLLPASDRSFQWKQQQQQPDNSLGALLSAFPHLRPYSVFFSRNGSSITSVIPHRRYPVETTLRPIMCRNLQTISMEWKEKKTERVAWNKNFPMRSNCLRFQREIHKHDRFCRIFQWNREIT